MDIDLVQLGALGVLLVVIQGGLKLVEVMWKKRNGNHLPSAIRELSTSITGATIALARIEQRVNDNGDMLEKSGDKISSVLSIVERA